jgi:hypothetical protein
MEIPLTLPAQQTIPNIWEWQRETGWVKYDAHTTALIDAAYNSNTLTLKLTHGFFGESGGYTVNFSTMVQVRDSTAYERPIRRIPEAAPLVKSGYDLSNLAEYDDEDISTLTEYDEELFSADTSSNTNTNTNTNTPSITSNAAPKLPATTERKPYWEWFNDSIWNAYDPETNDIIEEAYTNKSPTVSLNHGFFGDSGGYTIDFTNMNQIRDSTGYARQIRRTPPAISIPGAIARPPKIRQKIPAVTNQRTPETIHCDPQIMSELQSALHLLSNKQNDVEEVPVQEIFVEDD